MRPSFACQCPRWMARQPDPVCCTAMSNCVALKCDFDLAARRYIGGECNDRPARSGNPEWVKMGANNLSKAFGRIFAPREDWLALAQPEEILEPELAIIDSHHHLWEAAGRYLLEDYLADVGTGHNVVATVVIESGSHQRTKGPVEFRLVGEVEFAASVAGAMWRPIWGSRTLCVAAGIVGSADLTLGDRVEHVLAALIEAGAGRLRGIRHSAGWHDDPCHRKQSPWRRSRTLFARGFSSGPRATNRHGTAAGCTGLPSTTRRSDRSGANCVPMRRSS